MLHHATVIGRAPRTRPVLWLGALVLAAGAAAWLLLTRGGDAALCAALARGRVVRVFADDAAALRCEGVSETRLEDSPVDAALAGDQSNAVAAALTKTKGSALALSPRARARGVGKLVGELAHLEGLRGLALSPEVAVYTAFREPVLSLRERDALAYVARAVLRGAREPSLSSFPPALRRVGRVEVMVSINEHGRARLWRSARGTSIARALLTATRVARDRWHEREQAMGGPLPKRLPEFDVEVSLLSEDGTLTQPTRNFVDRAVTPVHGVGFDYRSDWHYLPPPEVVRRGKGSAYLALTALAADQALPASVLSEPTTRIYRFVALMLGVSKAPLGGAPAGADAGSATD